MSAEWEDIDESQGIAGPWPEGADPMVLWQQWRTPAINSGLPPRRLLRLVRPMDQEDLGIVLGKLKPLGWIPVWSAPSGLACVCVEAEAGRQGAVDQVLIRVEGVVEEAPIGDLLVGPGV